MNRFKGLDLVDRVPEELCTEVCNIVQEAVTKNHTKEKEIQDGKVVVWELRKEKKEKKSSKRQWRKGKIYPTECRVTENSKKR